MQAPGLFIFSLMMLSLAGFAHGQNDDVEPQAAPAEVETAAGPADESSTVISDVDTVAVSANKAGETGIPDSLADELSRLKPKKESADSDSQSGILDMAMGLMAVLGVIVVLAWLAKRFNVSGMSISQSLKLQSVLSLGTKEKVVIVNVEGRRFLLGVTPHQINVLSELEAGGETSGNEWVPANSSFAQQIKKALTQGKLGEDSRTS
jgi:flagellar protein FliO/FliZ